MWRNLWSGKIYLNKIENGGGGLKYEKSGLNTVKICVRAKSFCLYCVFSERYG